jgi:hypothetical protein
MLITSQLDPTCSICAILLKEVYESVRAHLRVIDALEIAVRENCADTIPTIESELIAARELSDDGVWKYRAHVASVHSVNTSVAV